MSTMSICQCDTHNAKECDNALFLNERLSDLKITFPSHNISFPAHRLVMAKKSSYFENLFYGSMAMHDNEWKVRDNDIEPDVFKIVLAHFYDVNLLDNDFIMTLQIYKLADFYVIDSLKSQCRKHIQDIISEDNKDLKWDYQYLLDWSKEFGFNDINNEVFECLSKKLCGSYQLCDDMIDISFVLNLTLETFRELLGMSKIIDVLIFKESWHNPKNPLSSDLVITLVESASRKGSISILQGCLSPQVVNKSVNRELCSKIRENTIAIAEGLFLSLIDILHSQALYESIKDLIIDIESVYLHIPCNSMSPNDLSIWSSKIFGLYLSDVDDQSIHWAASTIISTEPTSVYFPRSSLSINSFKALITILIQNKVSIGSIDICSSYIRLEYGNELQAWLRGIYTDCDLNIWELDDQMHGW